MIFMIIFLWSLTSLIIDWELAANRALTLPSAPTSSVFVGETQLASDYCSMIVSILTEFA